MDVEIAKIAFSKNDNISQEHLKMKMYPCVTTLARTITNVSLTTITWN